MSNFISICALLFILMSGTLHAQTTFKHLSDYRNIVPTKHSDPSIMRVHYWAKLKINDRSHDALYKNNTWKLVMRRGLYLAQVDKAMSEMYQYFLGYSTDVDLVSEGSDYYIARRAFKHFSNLNITKKNNQYYIDDYLILDDGTLTSVTSVKHFSGLAKVAALTDFFGETDAELFNCGLQKTDTEFRVVQYDNEHALGYSDDDYLNRPDIEKTLQGELGGDFIKMTWYQKEKQQMLEKIATTDFAIIEGILRKNITVSSLEEARWTLKKILSDPTVLPEFDRKEVKQNLDELNLMDDKEYMVDKVIEIIKAKQVALRESLHR